MKPQFTLALSTFVVCALIAAFGSQLLFSYGRPMNKLGCFLLVVFGLGAITLPLLVAQLGRGRKDAP